MKKLKQKEGIERKMINNVTLVGRLANDVDLRYTSSGIAVGQFRLAVNRNFTNQSGGEKRILLVVRYGAKRQNRLPITHVKVAYLELLVVFRRETMITSKDNVFM